MPVPDGVRLDLAAEPARWLSLLNPLQKAEGAYKWCQFLTPWWAMIGRCDRQQAGTTESQRRGVVRQWN